MQKIEGSKIIVLTSYFGNRQDWNLSVKNQPLEQPINLFLDFGENNITDIWIVAG